MNSNNNRLSYRFPFWLTVIFLLLVLVPIGLLLNQVLLAKVSGILCLIVVLMALKFWFKIARLKSGLNERVLLTHNDWFEIERFYPSVRNWSKSDVRILKDRIGLMLANVELRKSKTELANRNEAIRMSFQFCVLNWMTPKIVTENMYLYIGANNVLIKHDLLTNKEEVFSLGFDQVTNSITELEIYYKGLNPNPRSNEGRLMEV